MSEIQKFIRTGGTLSESELVTMLRTEILAKPDAERRNWVQQALLSLDGFGGADHIRSANRIKSALFKLEKEVPGLEAIPDESQSD